MSFDNLPNELLLMIIEPYKRCHQRSPRTGQASVSSIEQADNTRRLAGFARVSKTWYGVIAPILYSTYVKPDNAYHRSSPPIATLAPLYAQPNKNLRLFLRSIITRPKLARDVKKLVLGSWDHTMTCFQYNNMLSSESGLANSLRQSSVAIPPGDFLRSGYKATLLSLRLTPAPPCTRVAQFVTNLFGGDEDAEVGLLIALTPNVHELYLRQRVDLGPFFWPLYNDYGTNSALTGALSRLDKITLDLPRNGFYPYRRLFSWLSDVEFLSSLTVEGCNTEIANLISVLGGPQLSHLNLQTCNLNVLQGTIRLKHLRWIVPGNAGFRPTFDEWNRCKAVLSLQKDSLESLHLEGDYFLTGGFDRSEISFKDFKRLKSLKIQQQFLFGYQRASSLLLDDLLPECLERFEVTVCMYDLVIALIYSLARRRHRTNLTHLTLGPFWKLPSILLSRCLRRQCARTGVKFKLDANIRLG